MDYIRQAKASGFRVLGYYFKCSPKEAIARNNQRTGKAKVPIPAILGAYKQLEVPSVEEGFDETYCVTLSPENQFKVEPGTDILAINLVLPESSSLRIDVAPC